MLKKITKVLTTAGLLISLISAEVSPGAVYAENGAPITAEASETTGIAETPEATASAVETDFVDNEALVTGIIVNTISDGTGNFDENDEICDLLNSQEVIEKADVIRCVGCWWFVRYSECADVDGELLCEDCTSE